MAAASNKQAASKKKTSAKTAGRASTRTNRTARAREKFLAEFRKRANVTDAVRYSGVARSTIYEWHKSDPEFAKAWEEAEAEATEALEREAYRRAVEGYEKPIAYQGEIVDYSREYSDRLLELLLRARSPERYSEKHRVDHSGSLNVSIKLNT